MIVFHSMCGLGNQLFQYAAARRLAHVRGVELAVDTSWHRRSFRHTTPREFALDRFAVRCRPLAGLDALRARCMVGGVLSHLPFPRPWTLFRERGSFFHEALLTAPDGTFLHGWFQSHRYFSDVRDLLLEELVPLDPPSEADARVLGAVRRAESVFVHVRRGDYVTASPTWHGTCDVEYYRAAFARVAARVREPTAFVFSDDPQWARAHLRFPAPTVFVDHNGPAGAHQDLRLMASCRHAIVANSSFSWWGAWLGRHEAKVVIAPRRWFADGRAIPDLLPGAWETV